MQREWFEIMDADGEKASASFDKAHISAVTPDGKGSIIICGGLVYRFVNLPYEEALKASGFVRNK